MKRPVIKDRLILTYIEELETKLSLYEKSPYVKTYLTLLHQLDDFNEQLTIQEKEMNVEGTMQKVKFGRIDLFGTKDEKEFERGFKYMIQVNDLLENIDKIRKKMTTEEKAEVDSNIKKPLSEDSAENYLKK